MAYIISACCLQLICMKCVLHVPHFGEEVQNDKGCHKFLLGTVKFFISYLNLVIIIIIVK